MQHVLAVVAASNTKQADFPSEILFGRINERVRMRLLALGAAAVCPIKRQKWLGIAVRKERNWLQWKALIAIHFNCLHADIAVDYKMAKRLFSFSHVVHCNWCFQSSKQL